jgi:NAD dependent epimerase/dehydratase family enzyme
VPVPVLKLMVGEMAMLILNSANISCDKIQGTGFKFSFTSLEEALRDLLG